MPRLLSYLARLSGSAPRGRIQYSGNYPDWQSAARDSKGYDAELILEKATRAMTAVRSGEAAYERDTVLFDEIEHSFPLLASLLYAASRNRNRLCVLDFGGALGTSYIQNRQFLAHLDSLRWHIVEQPHVAAAGRRLFEDEHLRFFDSIEDATAAPAPDIVMLCGVVQYLPEPFELIARIKALAPALIVLDRVVVLEKAPTRLTVQTVPPHIYDASYPCWMFNRGAVVEAFADGYRKLFDFSAHAGEIVDLGDAKATYGGWLFERR
ncbi:MAG: methyltransferase, TIGR04325 family [Burkholderiales bacterium]